MKRRRNRKGQFVKGGEARRRHRRARAATGAAAPRRRKSRKAAALKAALTRKRNKAERSARSRKAAMTRRRRYGRGNKFGAAREIVESHRGKGRRRARKSSGGRKRARKHAKRSAPRRSSKKKSGGRKRYRSHNYRPTGFHAHKPFGGVSGDAPLREGRRGRRRRRARAAEAPRRRRRARARRRWEEKRNRYGQYRSTKKRRMGWRLRREGVYRHRRPARENPISAGGVFASVLVGGGAFYVAGWVDRIIATHQSLDKSGVLDQPGPGQVYNGNAVAAPMNWKRWLAGLLGTAAPIALSGVKMIPDAGKTFLRAVGIGVGVRTVSKGLDDVTVMVAADKSALVQRAYQAEIIGKNLQAVADATEKANPKNALHPVQIETLNKAPSADPSAVGVGRRPFFGVFGMPAGTGACCSSCAQGKPCESGCDNHGGPIGVDPGLIPGGGGNVPPPPPKGVAGPPKVPAAPPVRRMPSRISVEEFARRFDDN